MPVNLSIKNVPDALVQRLRKRAAANGRSLEQEMLAIITSATEPQCDQPREGAVAGSRAQRLGIEQLLEAAQARFPRGTPSSVEFIRAQRDAGMSVDLGDWSGPGQP